jgi:hypothetical protein
MAVAVTFVMLAIAGTVSLTYRPAGAQSGEAQRPLADEVARRCGWRSRRSARAWTPHASG